MHVADVDGIRARDERDSECRFEEGFVEAGKCTACGCGLHVLSSIRQLIHRKTRKPEPRKYTLHSICLHLYHREYKNTHLEMRQCIIFGLPIMLPPRYIVPRHIPREPPGIRDA